MAHYVQILPMLLLLILLPQIMAHGLLCEPRQRGAYHSVKCGSDLPKPAAPVTDHCAHCLNGGSAGTVKRNLPAKGWTPYRPLSDILSARRAGLCGDPIGSNEHMRGGKYLSYPEVPLVAHWKTASFIDLQVEIDTNHNGYFEFLLCDLDKCRSSDISERCITAGHCHRLVRVPHPDCQKPSSSTYFECGPIDQTYPTRWYVPCRKGGHVNVHLVGGEKGTMRYALPKGLSCEHCVLQWYWATANTCAPEGFLDYFDKYRDPFGTTCPSDGGGLGAHREGMTTCAGQLVPEEFWSCADVKISALGSVPSAPLRISRNGPRSTSGTRGIFQAPAPMQRAKPKRDDANMSTVVNTDPGKMGTCLKIDQTCTGKIPCCGDEMVCAHIKAIGFRCRVWYELWQEAQRI